MNDLIGEWKDAARRADAVRNKIAGLARASVPVSRDLLVELARAEDEVAKSLDAVRRGRVPAGPTN